MLSRIGFLLHHEHRAAIEAAALLSKKTMSEFVRDAAYAAAVDELNAPRKSAPASG